MSIDHEMAAMLHDSARRYADDHYGLAQRQSLLDAGRGHSSEAWRSYAELGWLALRLPEEHGGLAADPGVVGALMEVVGSHLLMEPLLSSALVATELLLRQGSAAQQQALLPALAEGQRVLVLADRDGKTPCTVRGGQLSGEKLAILHGDLADTLIVPATDADGSLRLYLVDAATVERTPYRLIDGRGAANVRFDRAAAEALIPEQAATAESALAEAHDWAAVAQCAEALGIARVLVDETCEYLKIRQQFGRPLASNQVLQHRAVEMYLLQEEIAALAAASQQALVDGGPERARLISGARAYISNAARRIANDAIQLHGGVGITEELAISHYFRRLMVNRSLFRDRDAHFNRFVELSSEVAA